MNTAEGEFYDRTHDFENEVAPLLQELKRVCNINRIPMFVCVATKNTPEGATYKSDILSPAQFDLKLKENYFSDFLNILNGFATTYFQASGDQRSNEEYEDLVTLMNESEKHMKNNGGSSDGGEDEA